MEKELNLVDILKDCPKGTQLYSPLVGQCELIKVDITDSYPIIVRSLKLGNISEFTKEGEFYIDGGECILFPSKENRDWYTFKVEPIVKTWEDIPSLKGYYISNNSTIDYINCCNKSNIYGKNLATSEKICKSMLAMAQISQLMPYYGGEVTYDEWNKNSTKYSIYRWDNAIKLIKKSSMYAHLSFHTEEQRIKFLTYNRQLVKDYLMIE